MLTITKILVVLSLVCLVVYSVQADSVRDYVENNVYEEDHPSGISKRSIRIEGLLPGFVPNFVVHLVRALDRIVAWGGRNVRGVVRFAIRSILKILYRILPKSLFWNIIPRGLLEYLRQGHMSRNYN